MSYEVRFRPAAERDLRALPDGVRRRVMAAVEGLAEEPRPPDSQELRGDLRGMRRLRVGPYRVSYVIEDGARTVRVGRVGHRHNFYRLVRQ